jgi:hypothetical protein
LLLLDLALTEAVKCGGWRRRARKRLLLWLGPLLLLAGRGRRRGLVLGLNLDSVEAVEGRRGGGKSGGETTGRCKGVRSVSRRGLDEAVAAGI